ncbi:hypothetical protein ACFFWC_09590 [Plantactinospora siamensis]|uniref:LemA family protein n=1 Tax=Plantactinospora siamensis TaxID=555372 RepID=A0ABV6P5I3_9ACTN
MLANAIQIFGLLAVVVTLYFAGVQTRKLQQQLDLTNLFSRYEVLNHSSERYDAALALVFQRPQLRPYIFGRRPLDLGEEDLARALVIADLMAGAVDYAVRVGARFPEDAQSGWTEVAEDMAAQPLFQRVVNEQPHHFPDLIRIFRRVAPVADRSAVAATGKTADEVRVS